MESQVPAGDIATGLAWSYFTNYLKVNLLGRTTGGRGEYSFMLSFYVI